MPSTMTTMWPQTAASCLKATFAACVPALLNLHIIDANCFCRLAFALLWSSSLYLSFADLHRLTAAKFRPTVCRQKQVFRDPARSQTG
jgi:hypothetical protein